MVGQQHVVTALRNAVREGRTGHAYLFSGPRGTGKTSTARILAKALNCTNALDGEPCGTCESCVAMDGASSYDLHELDAASNNGVEAMRDLIAKAALGSPGRTKVYILDEVHMLSTAASNALLKTLEEPPPHVTFVLATTDPQKVLPTIRSRAQHFEFSLIPGSELDAHVRRVMADADIKLDDEAVAYVVRKGAGSARDTLSALDQAAALGGIQPDGESLDDLIEALVSRDTGQALRAVASVLQTGREPRQVAEQLLARLRDVFLLTVGGPVDHLPDDERARVADVGQRFGPAAVTRALEALGEALVEMRQSPDPRVPFEVALVRLTTPQLDTSLAALVQRVAELEALVASGGAAKQPAGAAAPAPAATAPAGSNEHSAAPSPDPFVPATVGPDRTAARPGASEPSRGPAAEARRRLQSRTAAAPTPAVSAGAAASAPDSPPPDEAGQQLGPPLSELAAFTPPAAAPSDGAGAPGMAGLTVDEILGAWQGGVFDSLTMKAKARYRGGRFVSAEADTAVFGLPNSIHRDRCEEIRPEVEAVLGRHFGRPIGLRLVVDEAAGAPAAGGGPPPFPSRTATDLSSAPSPLEEDDEHDLDIHDVHSLPDATDVASGVLDRLLQAFPGSQVVE
jgi:DNA polymerase-3 subunit gamma/tau